MFEDMNALNEELSHCLKTALREKKNLRSYSGHYFKNWEEGREVLDRPVTVRYGLVITLAEELDVVNEVYSILFRWQLRKNSKPTQK